MSEKASSLERGVPAGQVKDKPTEDHLEHYEHKTGFSYGFAAIAETRGFKPEDGRLVIDPQEAIVEYGEEIGRSLKLNARGTKVLWPQPSDDPNDPQNWSTRKKNVQLLVLTMASFVPDFCSGLGIAGLFGLAASFNTTTDEINNLTSNWSIFMLGPGGICAVFFIKRYGRLPVLFWSQVFGLGFTIGCAVAPNLSVFAAMRILQGTFQTAPQCVGLWTVADLFPFHLQARKINLWTLGFIVSPFISPWLLGYMFAHLGGATTEGYAPWRSVYWVGVGYCTLVVILLATVMEETMYDRDVIPFPERPTSGLRYRVETLVGITGVKMAKHRCSWTESILSVFNLVWRPHLLLALIYVGVTFGFGIGINVTNPVFTNEPVVIGGFGWTAYAGASIYLVPIVAVLIGEVFGHFFNDWVADRQTKRNNGVFLAEMRLWTVYPAIVFFVAGFILLGFTYEKNFGAAGIAFGWGMAEVAILVQTVAIYAYLASCFPTAQGEVSALVNFARTMGGFAVPYYQVPMAEARGASAPFGMEAGIAAGLFILIIPFLQWKGAYLRHKYSIHRST